MDIVDISPQNNYYKHHVELFRKLRDSWGISEEQYEDELSETTFVKGAGKSGMKMWFSKSKHLFVKELSKDDDRSLNKLMKKYTEYMLDNEKSLLPKFHGVYKNKGVVFIVQENLNPFDEGTWTYDLKGSRRGRTEIPFSIKKIGKDNNFGASKIYIKEAEQIKNQMKKDTQFLHENNLMDYSLLVCIRNTPNRKDNWIGEPRHPYCCKFEGPGPSEKTNINLNIGIIDILQNFNMRKTFESFFKSKQHINDRHKSEVSAINSKAYKRRFDDYFEVIIHPFEEQHEEHEEQHEHHNPQDGEILTGGKRKTKRHRKRHPKRHRKTKRKTKRNTKRHRKRHSKTKCKTKCKKCKCHLRKR